MADLQNKCARFQDAAPISVGHLCNAATGVAALKILAK